MSKLPRLLIPFLALLVVSASTPARADEHTPPFFYGPPKPDIRIHARPSRASLRAELLVRRVGGPVEHLCSAPCDAEIERGAELIVALDGESKTLPMPHRGVDDVDITIMSSNYTANVVGASLLVPLAICGLVLTGVSIAAASSTTRTRDPGVPTSGPYPGLAVLGGLVFGLPSIAALAGGIALGSSASREPRVRVVEHSSLAAERSGR